jgi:hypothetical protein
LAKRAPDLPLDPLRDLLAWWRKSRAKGFIIGGLAVGLLGRPRTTRDVDAIIFIDEPRWPTFLEKGRDFTFQSRILDPLPFARQNRVFLLHHGRSGFDVDLSLGALPFELEALARLQKKKVGRLAVPVPTCEDLIVMKAVANRPIDNSDVDSLLSCVAKLDYAYIRKHVAAFAQLLDTPEIYEDLDRRLTRHKKEKRHGP